MRCSKAILIIILLLSNYIIKAQTIAEAEQQMASYLHAMNFWRYVDSDSIDLDTVDQYDSIIAYNEKLGSYLTSLINTQPEILTAKLAVLQDAGMDIVTAPDSKVRLYSWDTQMGGTMRDYANIIQYATQNGTKAFEETEGGVSFYSIYHIKAQSKKNYYLAIYNARLSTKLIEEGVKAYIIEDNELKPANIFHTPSKTYNTISYSYDLYTAMNDDEVEGTDIALSDDYNKLYIPIIEGEHMTNRRLVYVFDGEKFVFDKHAK
ncbi:MAG: hypothetical protein R2800_13015 [Flavipsychrobacter sp.]